jgi:hypothetical protein
MSLTAEIELSIRKALAEKMANVGAAGYIIPAPVFFVDKADYFAVIKSLILDTQKELELTNVVFCVITLLKFEDSKAEGCGDEPLCRLTYNFHFFSQYDNERADESEIAPDEFLKKTLKSYNQFIKALLDARNEFLGIQNLVSADFPDHIDIKTNPFKQDEFIVEKGKCRYIPDAKGHSIDLQSITQVLINEAYG